MIYDVHVHDKPIPPRDALGRSRGLHGAGIGIENRRKGMMLTSPSLERPFQCIDCRLFLPKAAYLDLKGPLRCRSCLHEAGIRRAGPLPPGALDGSVHSCAAAMVEHGPRDDTADHALVTPTRQAALDAISADFAQAGLENDVENEIAGVKLPFTLTREYFAQRVLFEPSVALTRALENCERGGSLQGCSSIF